MSSAKWLYPSILLTAITLAGCTSYKAPGAGANMGKLLGIDSVMSNQNNPAATPSKTQVDDLQKNYDLKPESKFPAHIIFMRLQDKGYESYSIRYGNDTRGDFSVISVRDIEKNEDFDKFRNLAGIAQVGTLTPLLLPARIETEKDIRLAASRLQADVLFIYTIDTKFWSEDAAAPLSVVTLGLSPSVTVNMVSTVSGILVDVRTGYVYGMVESTDKQTQLSAWWTNGSAVDQSRQRTERAAFEKMLGELEKLWLSLVTERMNAQIK